MANKSRPLQVKFRLNEKEAEILKKKVEASGLSQQEYLLKCALQKEMKVIDLSELKEVMTELQRQGNNLNQLTKKLNERGFIDYKNELPTIKELKNVWQQLNQFLQNNQ